MLLKRSFDWLVSSLSLIFLAPLFLVLAILIKMDSSGPVFFRQERIGQFGKIFRIHKFRTMTIDAEKNGPQITIGHDVRITSIGFWLRKYKIDELPQLIDVWLGEMSIVGPRPEVSRYVAYYPTDKRQTILSIKPGITDNASIFFRDENLALGASKDPESTYVDLLLPQKLKYYEEYVRGRTFFGDLLIIIKTVLVILR